MIFHHQNRAQRIGHDLDLDARSNFSFSRSDIFPSPDEQAKAYLDALEEKMRTMKYGQRN